MPNAYTSIQYANMHYIYGECQGNARAAARLYRQRYPNEDRYPDYRVFINVHRLYSEAVIPGRADHEQDRGDHDLEMEDEVIQRVRDHPGVSVRSIEQLTGIPKSSAHRILQRNRYHPYHYQKVQALLPRDYQPRVAFCRRMLAMHRADPNFLNNILWSDESSFKKDGFLNLHNVHEWNINNPHGIREEKNQYQFKVNMWTGIINGRIIGPSEFPEALTGHTYLRFLRRNLPDLLDDVPLATRRDMWLQNDGCPAHYALEVRNYLNEIYPGRWIGRMGPILWPARSPDLNSLDFFYWGYLKNKVYETPIPNLNELRRRLHHFAAEANERRLARFISRSFIRRCHACVRAGGRQFEHLL